MLGRQRDALQALRPDGCWCLGLGGKRGHWLSDTVYRYDEYCGCEAGQIAAQVAKAEEIRQEKHRKTVAIFRAIEAAGIPSRFYSYRLGNFPATAQTQPIIDQLRFWATGDREPSDRFTDAEWEQFTEAERKAAWA